MNANAVNAGIDRKDRRRKVNELVDADGGDALLERQLDAVGQTLQDAPRPRPVGAGPQLHPAQDLALEQDRDQHVQHQEHEDGQRLAQYQPPGVVSEGGS